jgi:ADP-ribose pyrophosphatase
MEVIGSDGRAHTLDYVKHPGAAVVLPVLGDGRVALIRNHRPVVDDFVWELPAGTLDGEEAPEVCARRELIEEAGYEAGSIEPLSAFYSTPGVTDEVLHAFVATDLRRVERSLEPDERIEVHLVEGSEAVAMARDGRMKDSKSMLALLLAASRGLIDGGWAGNGKA